MRGIFIMFGITAALALGPLETAAASGTTSGAKPPSTPARAGARMTAAGVNSPFWAAKPTAAQFSKLQDTRLATARASIAKMVAAKGPRTIENTLVPYDEALRQLDLAGSQSSLIQNVHPMKPMREAAEKAQQSVSAFGTELSLNRAVYDALTALDLSGADAATQHLVKRTLRDFRLAGVDKTAETRDKIKKLSAELVEISQEFDRNIRDDKRFVMVKSAAELDGLPKDFIDRHKPEADGSIKITTEYPDAVPVFAYAKSEALRQRLYMEYNNRAHPKNLDVLDRMIARRHELAGLIGYSSWADYITADKMVSSAKNASDFIDGVAAASGTRSEREYGVLLARKRKDTPAASAVQFWENNYYLEQVRKTDYNFDSQKVRPYFAFANVQKGVLDITGRIFGVEFRKVKNPAVWHPSVDCFEMFLDGQLAGRFYLDLHPRENKFSHAAQFDIRTGIAGRQIPEAALVCNFAGGVAGDPGLMEFQDVTTFFHEFGHLLHTMLAGRQQWVGIGGIRTEQDFVEAPSQMLEEWCKNPRVLATFARHHETGEPIPAELVKQMNRANDFGKGLQVRRQMVYAATSLAAYNRDPKTLDTTKLIEEMTKKYQPYPWVEGLHWQTAFGHLDGYSAVYYTYMWSLVIAKDMFSQFDQGDLLAPGAATRYRTCVLEPGGSRPAKDLVECFLGRPFSNLAWKKWLEEN
ncbi:MAG: M3 family metallopeptidase [Candidatus Eisenbacteria bacterium]